MIAPIKRPTKAKPLAPLYHLEITLEQIQPRIWRRLQVPGNANLGWLHAVFQVAMGWTNSHLHQFRIGDQICSDPAFELDEFEGDPPVMDERRVILMDVSPKAGDVLAYEYDFGDSWRHGVTVRKILPADSTAAQFACCLGGARACPPEDCGGPWGYAELLEVITNPKNKKYPSTMDWLGGKYDPDAFHIETVNACLRKLKWPRVTERQLRSVLITPDND